MHLKGLDYSHGWSDVPHNLHHHVLICPQVCDSILNIGPCANASMGEPAFLSEEVQ